MTAHLHLLLGAGLVLATAGIIFGLGWEARGCWSESRVSRLADPEPMPVELPSCFELRASYGPFPVDTGPLLLLSEQAAAKADLARDTARRISETDWLIGEGERQIGPVR